jgi:oligogalacturonide lyase
MNSFRHTLRVFAFALAFVVSTGFSVIAADLPPATGDEAAIPNEWTDPSTGYRLIRLSRRPGPNLSFYFHNNPFVPATRDEGDKMLFYGTSDEGMQLFALNLKTLDAKQLTHRSSEPGIRRMRGVRGEIVSPKLREALYQWRDEIFAVNVDTGVERHVATLPNDLRGGVATINADGTLLAGTYSSGSREIFQRYPRKADFFDRIFEANLPSKMFTVDLRTGKSNVIHEEKAWLNHLQFSPTDPNLLMYCHEGPWHKLHRIWLIDVSTRKTRKIHERTVDREIAGHEFWSPDGRTIWFDLQIPRGETFYLASYDLAANRETRYPLTRNEWSVHYNISRDQKLFCGDGGNTSSVAHADDGKWIYLFEPDGDKLRSTRLANLSRHDYDLEPNAHFSPDRQWIIFRSNIHGEAQIYGIALK